MRVDILTVIPDIISGPFEVSIMKIAKEKGLLDLYVHNIRDYAEGKYKKVDDHPYGGEPGMVMLIEPIDRCISALKKEREYDQIIYMTPDGETLNQKMCNIMSSYKNIIILCGHYKGVDQRVRELFITKEISIGDYVLSGGELGACVLVDSIVRLIPGVLNDENSALSDSFQDDLLAPPIYTRPREYKGLKVPDVLLCGNFNDIYNWKQEMAYKRTKERRPDLLK